jgi:type IX secretion system PorP/SprF family membrane protein
VSGNSAGRRAQSSGQRAKGKKKTMMMKRYIIIGIVMMVGSVVSGQQVPLSENYFNDRYSLAPSYAGNFNPRYIFSGYRSDWSGIKGGPKTLRLSYNDALMQNAGYGGKIIYDRVGIFRQLYVMGSYSYRLEFVESHFFLFGLSAGVYSSGINMTEYYNDPDYMIDPALTNDDIRSKIKFMSDFSAVYRWQDVEAGILFSNIAFGDATYRDVDTKFKPLANFQFHGSYSYSIDETWTVNPLVIIRGGKSIRSQFELAAQAVYGERFWGSLVFRDPGILGTGLGLQIDKGLKLNYNFNFATNVELGAFNSHEIVIGVNVFEYLK